MPLFQGLHQSLCFTTKVNYTVPTQETLEQCSTDLETIIGIQMTCQLIINQTWKKKKQE